MNLSAILQGVRSVDKARVAKSGGVATIISAGLAAATVAGLPIPGWAPLAGALFGYVAYKFLPPTAEAKIDDVVDDAIDIATTIPQVYPDYTGTGNDPMPPVNTDFTSGGQ